MTKNRIFRWMLASVAAGMMTIQAQEVQVTDRQVKNAVEAEMRSDDAVSANTVDVTVLNGVVTLDGTVRNLYARERLEELASALVGVRSVVNLVKVVPETAPSGEDLSAAVERALLDDPATDSYEITVAASNGVVTLRGTVGSYAEYRLCEEVAKTVPGVSAIQNKARIQFKTERPDAEIKAEVRRRLENDVRVDDRMIHVGVENGFVRLSGAAGSLQEKNQARVLAWVSGVKNVNVDEVDIRWWARDEMRREELIASRTDEEIRQAVLDALMYDPRVSSFRPDVQVQNSIVSLSGVVTDALARQAAEQDARNTVGVLHVRNNLKVRPDVPGNAELKKRVEKMLLSSMLLSGQSIQVRVRDGWVTLSGQVETPFEQMLAQRKALRAIGVVGVINRIRYNRMWRRIPDRELKQNVNDQLFWSAFVNSNDITVSVENGVVTLRGTVQFWSEYDDAEKNAYQAGAKGVRNQLQVSGPDSYGPYGPVFVSGFPDITPFADDFDQP